LSTKKQTNIKTRQNKADTVSGVKITGWLRQKPGKF